MLASADGLKADERNLHTSQCTNGIPRRIGHVESAGEPTHEDQNQGVKWNHVCDESVSTYGPLVSRGFQCKQIKDKCIPQAATM